MSGIRNPTFPTSLKDMKSLTILGTLLASAVLAGAETKRPNIVIFLADDAGWGDYS